MLRAEEGTAGLPPGIGLHPKDPVPQARWTRPKPCDAWELFRVLPKVPLARTRTNHEGLAVFVGADQWELKVPGRGRGDHRAGQNQRSPDFKGN